MLLVYSPSIAAAGWAALLAVFGQTVTVAIVGSLALAVTFALHVREQRRRHAP